MITAKVLSETAIKTEFKHREWNIVPNAANPNCFNLETVTGNVVCSLSFPADNTTINTEFLNLISCAPELQDIAEMYHDAMVGNKAEKTMVFSIVREILGRLQ